MAPAEDASMLRVDVVFCPRAGEADCVVLAVAAGSSLGQAVQASGLLERHGLRTEDLHVGVWGRTQTPAFVLRDRDRVELYRPLLVDPKEARRQRYQQHRAASRAGTSAG